MSWVYFVVSVRLGLVKIGWTTKSPTERLGDLQVGSADQLVIAASLPGGRDLETELHRRFRRDRVRGEWFRLSPSVVSLIQDCGGRLPEQVGNLSVREAKLQQIASTAHESETDSHAVHSLISDVAHIARLVGEGVEPHERKASDVMRALDGLAATCLAWSNALDQDIDFEDDVYLRMVS